MEKEYIRFYIFTRFKLGVNATNIHQELCDAWGVSCISYRDVAKWVHEFREGRQSVEDEPRPGRPVTETTLANIEAVRTLIDSDSHISVRYIVIETGLTLYAVYNIITNHLKLRKLCTRWVPHSLSAEQKEKRIRICQENLEMFESGRWRMCDVVTGDETWIYFRQADTSGSWVAEGERPSTAVRRGASEPKTMFCVFFMTNGTTLIHQVPSGQSVDATYYLANCLEPLVEQIKTKRPTKGLHGIKLHFDNASVHKASIVNGYLAEKSITVMPHPAYSPDLAACDFWLFGFLKRQLGSYPDEKSLQRGVTQILENIPEETYRKTFDNWIKRMKLCIEHHGEYFEHLIK